MTAQWGSVRRGQHTMFLRNDTLLSGIGLPKLPLRATTLGVIVPDRPTMTGVRLHDALELSLPHVKEKAKFLSVNSQQLPTKGAHHRRSIRGRLSNNSEYHSQVTMRMGLHTVSSY